MSYLIINYGEIDFFYWVFILNCEWKLYNKEINYIGAHFCFSLTEYLHSRLCLQSITSQIRRYISMWLGRINVQSHNLWRKQNRVKVYIYIIFSFKYFLLINIINIWTKLCSINFLTSCDFIIHTLLQKMKSSDDLYITCIIIIYPPGRLFLTFRFGTSNN